MTLSFRIILIISFLSIFLFDLEKVSEVKAKVILGTGASSLIGAILQIQKMMVLMEPMVLQEIGIGLQYLLVVKMLGLVKELTMFLIIK